MTETEADFTAADITAEEYPAESGQMQEASEEVQKSPKKKAGKNAGGDKSGKSGKGGKSGADGKAAKREKSKKQDRADRAEETDVPMHHVSLYDWERSKNKKKKKKSVIVQKETVNVGSAVIGDGQPKICVPVVGETLDEIRTEALLAAACGPDLVEWRADAFEDIFTPAEAKEAMRILHTILGGTPLLFTYRTVEEGGMGIERGDAYRDLILWAARQPEISLIDIEGRDEEINAEALTLAVQRQGIPVIASAHYTDRTPGRKEMRLIFDALQRTGANILKLAVMPLSSADVLKLMQVTGEKNAAFTCPLITVAMGDMGRLSRISGGITGSAVTFGTAGRASAPGQMSVDDLRMVLDLLHTESVPQSAEQWDDET